MMKHTHTMPGTFFIKFTLLLMACFYLAFPATAQPLNALRQQAEQGSAQAQYQLGRKYDLGQGIQQNYVAAASWYLKAAEQGHVNAQYSLADMYYQGDGIARDLEAAFSWFLKAAQQGNSHAQFNVAHMYYHGEGVQQNQQQAQLWMTRAAAQGDTKAQNALRDWSE
jgi:TPR repeat protein